MKAYSKYYVMKKVFSVLFLLSISATCLHAQHESMLKDLEPEKAKKEYVTNAFKSSRVVNGHSMELIGKGVLDFRILHRFGRVNQGVSEFFGLDQASMRMGFDYGVGKNLTIGIGRSTLKKELDGFIKWRPLRQTVGGFPFTWLLITGTSIFTFKTPEPQAKLAFSSRVAYYYQTIIGRKFTNRFSLQLSPTLVHRNEVNAGDINDSYVLGIGSRFKLSKRTALVVDYFASLNRPENSPQRDALSIGIDIETGGHVFQLHFSNSSGLNERAFITDTQDMWGKGDIRFGFNLSRVFTVSKNH